MDGWFWFLFWRVAGCPGAPGPRDHLGYQHCAHTATPLSRDAFWYLTNKLLAGTGISNKLETVIQDANINQISNNVIESKVCDLIKIEKFKKRCFCGIKDVQLI